MKQVILDSNFNSIAVEWGIDKTFFKECGYEILETKNSENETLRNNVADEDIATNIVSKLSNNIYRNPREIK